MRRQSLPWDLEMVIVGAISTLVLLVAIAPIVTVVLMSFTSGETLAFPPPGWGLRWYQSVLNVLIEESNGAGSSRFVDSLVTSFAIATAVMVLSIVAGAPASYALVRYEFRGKMLVEQLVSTSLVFPMLVLGIGMLVLVSTFKLELGFWRIVTAHVIHTFPFVVRNCTASLRGVSSSFEEASRTLGAGWWRTFIEIVLPLMRPGILAGGVIAFIVSFNEFTVSFFLFTADVQPFPIWLYTRSHTMFDPTILAVASLIIVLNLILIFVLDRLASRQRVTF